MGILPELRGLDLTDTQKEQVKAVLDSHKSEMEAIGTRMRTARKALNDAVTADTFDEGAIRAKSADVAVVDADGAVLRAKVRGEVWALLTAEQKQKAHDIQTQMAQRMGQMRERMQQRRQQRQQQRQQAQD
jgi:protein CpxP